MPRKPPSRPGAPTRAPAPAPARPPEPAAPAARPRLIRLLRPHGFQTPWGGQRRWEEGEVTGYAHEIAMLAERGAVFEILE